jgi:hypothetical protein
MSQEDQERIACALERLADVATIAALYKWASATEANTAARKLIVERIQARELAARP